MNEDTTPGGGEAATKDEGARSFAVVLQHVGEGRLHTEASRELRALATELRAFAERNVRAKGTLTLTLTMQVGADGVAVVTGDVKTKAPKMAAGSSIFWLTKGDNLSPQNPKQTVLPLREVPNAAAPPRDVPVDHNEVRQL